MSFLRKPAEKPVDPVVVAQEGSAKDALFAVYQFHDSDGKGVLGM